MRDSIAHRRTSTVNENDLPTATPPQPASVFAADLASFSAGSASPNPQQHEYEARPSSPPSKRTSDFFESDMKRIRRDSCLAPVIPSRHRSHSAPMKPSPKWIFNQQIRTRAPKIVEFASTKVATAAIVLPPINQVTLRELDLSEIFKNAQLRHDIVHDPNLQFRPNLDSTRGIKKRQEAKQYWKAVAQELKDPNSSFALTSVMFIEMREILLSSLPTQDKPQVAAQFDTELILQELAHGSFDELAFASYLASIMKRYCAPMRDEPVDKMVEKTRRGYVTDGLRQAFEVLEMMKLDVANHQLTQLRPYFLQSSVEFVRSWFDKKFDRRACSLKLARAWLPQHLVDEDYRKAFVAGFVSFVKAENYGVVLPPTFSFDSSRLVSLSRDIRDLVSCNLTVLLARQLSSGCASPEAIMELKGELWSLLSVGEDRWFSDIQSLALHICKRTREWKSNKDGFMPISIVPSKEEVNFAEGWLRTHLVQTSPIYRMIQARILDSISQIIYHNLTTTAINGTKRECEIKSVMGDEIEIRNVGTRLSAIAEFNWAVHGQNYVKWSSL